MNKHQALNFLLFFHTVEMYSAYIQYKQLLHQAKRPNQHTSRMASFSSFSISSICCFRKVILDTSSTLSFFSLSSCWKDSESCRIERMPNWNNSAAIMYNKRSLHYKEIIELHICQFDCTFINYIWNTCWGQDNLTDRMSIARHVIYMYWLIVSLIQPLLFQIYPLGNENKSKHKQIKPTSLGNKKIS